MPVAYSKSTIHFVRTLTNFFTLQKKQLPSILLADVLNYQRVFHSEIFIFMLPIVYVGGACVLVWRGYGKKSS